MVSLAEGTHKISVIVCGLVTRFFILMLTREQKEHIIQEIGEKFSRKQAAFFVSFAGVDVKTSQDLRRQLAGIGGEYKVVKKTLLARSLKEMDINIPLEELAGQVGLAFDYNSQTDVAKTLSGIIKKSAFTILGGLVNDAFISSDKVKELALLPIIDIMRAILAFTLQSPIIQLARVCNNVQTNLINTLRALIIKKQTN